MRIKSILACIALAGVVTVANGCGGKVAQCNKLAKVINEQGGKIGSPSDAKGLKKMAGDLDKAAKEVEAVDVSIPELKKFRDASAKVIKDVAKAARTVADVKDAKDVKKLTGSMKSLQETMTKSSKLVNDVNSFCQGK